MFGLSAVATKAIGIGLLVLALITGFALFTAHEQAIGEEKNKAEVAQASMKLAQESAAKSAQIVATQQGVIHDAKLQVVAANAAADRASAAGNAFRVQLAAYVSSRRGPVYSPTPAGSAPIDGGDPIGVLADVLGRSDARADIVEGLADKRGIRASTCERLYDALTPAKP